MSIEILTYYTSLPYTRTLPQQHQKHVAVFLHKKVVLH